VPAKLNLKRLAFSLGIVGAIIVPLGTGSLMRFIRHPMSSGEYGMSREYTWTDAFTACALNRSDAVSCKKAENEPENADVRRIYYPPSLDIGLALAIVRDAAIGLFGVAVLVLVLPRALQKYWRWITS
jgi:hypothetical protein